MTLDIKPHPRIFRVAADLPACWKRELGEWLLAVAAVGVCVWIFRAIARAVFDVVIALSLFR